MIPELELLYNKSLESQELVRWLSDEGLIRDYRENARFSSEKQEQLLKVLQGEQLSLFQCFLDNELDRSDAERRMLFSQGFSIGLRLGALSAWA